MGKEMDSDRKKFLEKRGFTVGSVARFLGLKKEESMVIETKLSIKEEKDRALPGDR